MVTGISHDLRTPLTSIRGYIKGVLDGVADTPEKKEMYLRTAYESTGEMNSLLQKLFDFSRMESGQMPDVLLDVDAIIVTHTHPDHWDEAAVAHIPKDKLIYVQNEHDEKILRSQGFSNLVILSDKSTFGEISLIKTVCQHGSDEAYANPQLAAILGDACGVVFQHPSEKTLYLVGDTIWIKAVEDNLRRFNPGVVIMNTGWAHVLGFGPIIFGREDVLKAHRIVPEALIVATHMEAVNHCLLTRQELLEYARDNQIQASVVAPADGESVTI